MTDLLKEWHDLVAKEARAAAEAVVRERAGEVERALEGAKRALAEAGTAQHRAEAAAGMVETLRDLLARAPREVFLHDATLAVLTETDTGEHDELARPGTDAACAHDRIYTALHNRRPITLIQRYAAPLPAGRYAVVVSFHRIDGGEA